MATPPRLVESPETDPWGRQVRQLDYDCGSDWAAFAFSDESFRFAVSQPLADRRFRFSDNEGTYEVMLHEAFLRPDNPGNFRVDVWQLTHHGTTAHRIS